MAKRIALQPLPEDHDRYLTKWSWWKKQPRTTLIANIVAARIESNREEIDLAIARAAKYRGITFEEMEALIYANPKLDWDADSEQPED